MQCPPQYYDAADSPNNMTCLLCASGCASRTQQYGRECQVRIKQISIYLDSLTCLQMTYLLCVLCWQCDDQESVWEPALLGGAAQGSCMCKPGFLPFQPSRHGCGCYPQSCDPPCGNNSICMWTPEGMKCMCNCTGNLTCQVVQERSWECVTLLEFCPAPPKFRCLVGGCPVGSYRPACNGTEVTDPPCANCTVGGCQQGYYRPACTGQESTDSQCTACAAQTCTADFYVQGLCNGSASVDTSKCLPCVVTLCKPGQYIKRRCDGRTSVDTATCAECAIKWCQPGQYVSSACNGSGTSDGASCQTCLVGQCGAGFYRSACNGSAVEQPKCEPCRSSCPMGYFLSGELCNGDLQADVTVCLPCRQTCPAFQALGGVCNGTGRSDLSCTYLECGAGNYIDTRIITACVPCSIGTFQSQGNQTKCNPCGAGFYSNVVGATACLKCFAGKFNPNLAGNSTEACQVCPAGTIQPLDGQTSCDVCEEGSVSGGTGTTTPCQKCLPGSFQTGVGKSFCSSCPPGTFQVSTYMMTSTQHGTSVSMQKHSVFFVLLNPCACFAECIWEKSVPELQCRMAEPSAWPDHMCPLPRWQVHCQTGHCQLSRM